MRQIILDTETTGLSTEHGHRIIEIGCLEMINRRMTGNNYHVYINPERSIDFGAEQVHGITSNFLADKPVFAKIAAELIEFIRGAELIIHNAPFDEGFLNYEFSLVSKKLGVLRDYCRITDTLSMARQMHPGMKNSLDALCKRYNVDNSNRELHGALLDAELLAQVYLFMTGGQTQLFESAQAAASAKTAKKITTIISDRQPLPIIVPTEQELQAHQEYLKNLPEHCWDT